jgi:hypothetical protein
MVNLNVDGSLKGAPQSRIVDPRDVLFENSCAPRIVERGDHLADFAARPAKETRCRWTPLQPERVDFIGHGKYGRFILGIPGDGETQEEQEPFADSAGPPILRNELLHLISCHLGDRLYFAAPRRNGGASFMHGAGLDPKAATFQHGAKRSTRGGLQRVEPDDQHARATQEARHPIERRLDRFDRTLPSIEENHVVLPAREAAVRRSGCASVTHTMQIDHGLGAVGTGHDDLRVWSNAPAR